jgi:hypothetical protein
MPGRFESPHRPGILNRAPARHGSSKRQCSARKAVAEKTKRTGEEVNAMKYEKPAITVSADSVDIIQGMKLSGPADSGQPQNPIHTAAAYESDE